MADLVEFLRARLDEDEAEAKRQLKYIERHGTRVPEWEPALTSIANRVLAEVEAKRRIVELHAPPERVWTGSAYEDGKCTTCLISQSDLYGSEYETAPCPTLRALAPPFADHPDYDPAWSA